MSKTYLLTLRPMEPYFFGNEKTFAFNPKSPAENRYFIKSERMPLQTTVLGALRYLLMPVKNPDYCYMQDERERNSAIVGPASFEITNTEQHFGVIEKLSPIFLVHGEDKYVRTPFDHCPDVDGRYQPMTAFGTVKTDRGESIYFPDFNAKEGIHDSFMRVKDGFLVASSDIFSSSVRVGVNKLNRAKGFYKKQFMYLQSGWAFGAYVTVDVSRMDADKDAQAALAALEKGTISYLGQNKSAFVVRMVEESNTIAAKVSAHLQAGRVYCLGDALVNAAVYEKCAFAATQTRDYRAYITKFEEQGSSARYVGTVAKDARLYKLLCAGSVLIPADQQDISQDVRNAHCEQIGFNVTVPYGEE